MNRILVTCTGCGETWEAPATMVGALCGQGRVRPATKDEGDLYGASLGFTEESLGYDW